MILAIALAGLFVQDCTHAFRRSQDFRENQVIYSEENFFDAVCGDPSVVSRSYGAYFLSGAVGVGGATREIDFVFEKVTLEPKSEAVAASYRSRALCGLTGWEKGRETEISGLVCDFFGNGAGFTVPSAGERRYGIVAAEGGALRFGRLSPEFDGSTPSRRPVSLDPVPYLFQAD